MNAKAQAKAIERLRHSLRLTQAEFGSLLNAHMVTVCRWENPKHKAKPSPYQKALMATFEDGLDGRAFFPVDQLLCSHGVPATLFVLLHERHKKQTFPERR